MEGAPLIRGGRPCPFLLCSDNVHVFLAGVVDRDDSDNWHFLTLRVLARIRVGDDRVVCLAARCDRERHVDIAPIISQCPHLTLSIDLKGTEDYRITRRTGIDVSLRRMLPTVDEDRTRGEADIEMPALSLHGRLYIRQPVTRILMGVPIILVVIGPLASDKGSVALSQVKDIVVAVHPAGALGQLHPVVGLRHSFGVRDLLAGVVAPILLLNPVQAHICITTVV